MSRFKSRLKKLEREVKADCPACTAQTTSISRVHVGSTRRLGVRRLLFAIRSHRPTEEAKRRRVANQSTLGHIVSRGQRPPFGGPHSLDKKQPFLSYTLPSFRIGNFSVLLCWPRAVWYRHGTG